MSHPSPVLLVDGNDREVRALAGALGRRALTLPIHVRSGEQALLWREVHPCDACIIAHELPGMTGVQSMVHLHDRQSRLPVVVLSHAHGVDPRR
jgi:DNA-binding NtrC family response regulator